jgi:hypothetical protein
LGFPPPATPRLRRGEEKPAQIPKNLNQFAGMDFTRREEMAGKLAA